MNTETKYSFVSSKNNEIILKVKEHFFKKLWFEDVYVKYAKMDGSWYSLIRSSVLKHLELPYAIRERITNEKLLEILKKHDRKEKLKKLLDKK